MYAWFLIVRTINKHKDNVPLGEDIHKHRIGLRETVDLPSLCMFSKLNIRHNDEGLIFKSSRHVFQTTCQFGRWNSCRFQVAKIHPNPRGRWSRVRKASIFYTILMESVRWVEQSYRTWPNDCKVSGWNLGCKERSLLA